jgi:GNAT superfamily N-acetyltransferase
MENVKLRRYISSDYDTVLRLHFEGLQQHGVRINTELIPGLDDDLGRIEEEYLKDGDFLIATINEVPVGIGAIRKIDTRTMEIKRMRVEPAYQERGIGSMILDTLIEKARRLGYGRLILDTTDRMQVARHLYKSRGFREYRRNTFGNILVIYYEMDLAKNRI